MTMNWVQSKKNKRANLHKESLSSPESHDLCKSTLQWELGKGMRIRVILRRRLYKVFPSGKGCKFYLQLSFTFYLKIISIPRRLPLESNFLVISFNLFACEIIYIATASRLTCTHLSISRNFFSPFKKFSDRMSATLVILFYWFTFFFWLYTMCLWEVTKALFSTLFQM